MKKVFCLVSLSFVLSSCVFSMNQGSQRGCSLDADFCRKLSKKVGRARSFSLDSLPECIEVEKYIPCTLKRSPNNLKKRLIKRGLSSLESLIKTATEGDPFFVPNPEEDDCLDDCSNLELKNFLVALYNTEKKEFCDCSREIINRFKKVLLRFKFFYDSFVRSNHIRMFFACRAILRYFPQFVPDELARTIFKRDFSNNFFMCLLIAKHKTQAITREMVEAKLYMYAFAGKGDACVRIYRELRMFSIIDLITLIKSIKNYENLGENKKCCCAKNIVDSYAGKNRATLVFEYNKLFGERDGGGLDG